MDIDAWGAFHRVKDHSLAKNEEIRPTALGGDGAVSITVKSDRPFDLDGTYYVRVTFTAAEIDNIYRQSIAGTAKGLLNSV
jgi:hypothetical protein